MAKKNSRAPNGAGSITWVASRQRYCARLHFLAPDGSRRRKAFYAKTFAEADRLLTRMKYERDGGTPVAFEPEKITVGEYLARWLELAVAPTVGPGTYESYERVIRRQLAPAVGGLKLTALTRAHVEGLKKRALDEGLAVDSVNFVVNVLAAAMNRAVEWDLLKKSPVFKVKRLRARGMRMRCLSEEEAAALVGAVRGTRFEALYVTALKLGLRQGELSALKWADVDLEGLTALVRWSVNTTRAPIWSATKTGEARTIRLPVGVAEALRHHHKLQAAARLAVGGAWEDPTLVFSNTRGAVQRGYNLRRAFKGHLKKANLEQAVRFHDLRHTSATLMLKSRVSVQEVARILGHSDPAMTLRRYAWVLSDMEERTAEAIDSWGF